MKLSRRSILRGSAAALAAPVARTFGTLVRRGEPPPRPPKRPRRRATGSTGLSLFGEPTLSARLQAFRLRQPGRPAGRHRAADRLRHVRQFQPGDFRREGQPGERPRSAQRDPDHAGARRGLDRIRPAGGSGQLSADRTSVTYRLRANARWHDGKPVTPEDVIFSFDTFKENSPQLAAYYRHVTKAEKTGEREVTFVFDGPGNRELPQIVGQLTVLPKHWWEGTDAKGKKRDVTQTTLEPPLGSGPYRLEGFLARPHRWSTRSSPTIGARTSTSISAAITSRNSATNITATPPSRWKPSRATRSTGAPRSAPRTGRPLTTSRR